MTAVHAQTVALHTSPVEQKEEQSGRIEGMNSSGGRAVQGIMEELRSQLGHEAFIMMLCEALRLTQGVASAATEAHNYQV